MKKSVNFSDFADDFEVMLCFSYPGLRALFDYLEEYEYFTGMEIELDVSTLCYKYSEHGSALEAAEAQGFEVGEDEDEDEDEEDREAGALEWLQDHTTVIEFSGGVITQDF